ncbi:MAG TPA: hypothetical protein DCS93_00555 [Microscillaceae bacterium]|nr:hypothetical protein [Microscillaceae bacterium]
MQLTISKLILFTLLFSSFIHTKVKGQTRGTALLIAEHPYYSEYAPTVAALEATGFQVEVRSLSGQALTPFLIPNNADITTVANSLGSSSYAAFVQEYNTLTGQTWDPTLNPMPVSIPVSGGILSVSPNDINNYSALIFAGVGTPAAGRFEVLPSQDYSPYNGLSSNEVEAIAAHVQDLVLAAGQSNIPVVGQGFGAAIIASCNTDCGLANRLSCPNILDGQTMTGSMVDPGNTQAVLAGYGAIFTQAQAVVVTPATPQFPTVTITGGQWHPQYQLDLVEALLPYTPELTPSPPPNSILVFIADQNYYSETAPFVAAMQNMGFNVELRGANANPVTPYLIGPQTIDGVANSLAGSNYADFLTQFQQVTGQAWDPSLNALPVSIAVDGSILDITAEAMANYRALVVLGGIGATAYTLDGSYAPHGGLSAGEVQTVAEHLNTLAVAALNGGNPVVGICHGSTPTVHFRVPCGAANSVNCISLLDGQTAAGFAGDPTQTGNIYSLINVTYDPSLTVGESLTTPQFLPTSGNTRETIFTLADWYPQHIVELANALGTHLDGSPSDPEPPQNPPLGNVLIFAADSNYYSETRPIISALNALGYTTEVRTASGNPAFSYLIPSNSTLDNQVAPGSNIGAFQAYYQNLTGQAWDNALNINPGSTPSAGSILDVPNPDNYVAFIILGGSGITNYALDGSYVDFPFAGLNATQVQTVAEHISTLAGAFVNQGKPFTGVCHGSQTGVHCRVPDGSPDPINSPSLWEGGSAAGFPLYPDYIQGRYDALGVTYVADLIVGVAMPTSQFTPAVPGGYLLTQRDWYITSSLKTVETLHNLLQSTPINLTNTVNVVLLHGGPVTLGNCGAGNYENDVPCNHPHMPADHTNVEALLNANSPQDDFTFNVISLNLNNPASLPFDPNNEQQVLDYLVANADGLYMFKHWTRYLPDATQNAIARFVQEHGRGVFSNHHGLYNQFDNVVATDKTILVNLFGAQSSVAGFGLSLGNQTIHNVTPHFINTYGLHLLDSSSLFFNGTGASSAINLVGRTAAFTIDDEVYNNMSFEAGVSFGNHTNGILPIMATNALVGNQGLTTGFTREVGGTTENGKLAYIQVGERQEHYDLASGSPIPQMFRNALYWVSSEQNALVSRQTYTNKLTALPKLDLRAYPNPATHFLELNHWEKIKRVVIYNLAGKQQMALNVNSSTSKKMNVQALPRGFFVITVELKDGQKHQTTFVKK